MTRGPIEDYLDRLERELRQRGLEEARIIEEAREHLQDAVEDGRQRGLSAEDAAREAIERFGAPGTIAAQAAQEGDRIMNRFAAVLDTVWERKWWILAPTIVAIVVTSVASNFLPTRYKSESLMRVSRVPSDGPTDAERSRARVREITDLVLSRTRLERLINEFNLYEAKQTREPLDELVKRMRRDISIQWRHSEHEEDADLGGFNVSFVSADPRLALKVAERLAGEIIEANFRESDRRGLAEATTQFIDSETEDMRRRIIDYENRLETLRSQNGRRPLSRADLLPYEVLLEGYKSLLMKGEQARLAQQIERRQIGDQLRIIDPPRLPERPLGPSRLSVTVAGAFTGLGLGLVVVGVRSRSKKKSL